MTTRPRRELTPDERRTLRLLAALFTAAYLCMGVRVLATGVDAGRSRFVADLVVSTGSTAHWSGIGYLGIAALFLTGVTPATRLTRAIVAWLVLWGVVTITAFVMAVISAGG